jgi:phage gp46-like protein
MPTEVKSYVGSTASWNALGTSDKAYYTDSGGSNYTTPQLWDDAFGNTSGDLVSADQLAVAELNAEDFIGVLDIRSDWTTDATHYPVFRARAGSEYYPLTGLGAKIYTNSAASNAYSFFIRSSYVRFERLRLGSFIEGRPSSGIFSAYHDFAGRAYTCQSCTILSYADVAQADIPNVYFRACLFILASQFSAAPIYYKNLRNCTIICNAFIGGVIGEGTAYNTVIYDADIRAEYAALIYNLDAGGYNAQSESNGAGPTGASPIVDLPSSAFYDYDAGDYSLSGTSSPLYHSGSAAYAPELDINGTLFDTSNPSRGAFEFGGDSPTPTPPTPTPPTPTAVPPAFDLGKFESQQGDVSLLLTSDGADITISGGVSTMSGGLETTVSLSLFGGTEKDDGREGNIFNWWGNIDEVDPAREYRSETQYLLRALPATTGNLRRLEDAARRDLSWLEAGGAASSITVVASIPGVNKIKLTIDIEAIGEEASFEFVQNWKAGS